MYFSSTTGSVVHCSLFSSRVILLELNASYFYVMKKKYPPQLRALLIINSCLFLISLSWYRRSSDVKTAEVDNGRTHRLSESLTVLHSVPKPASERCTIFRCANRTMEHVQVFSHPSFYYIFLDESEDVRKAKIHPAWCRVSHLMSLRKMGHSCVVYADDDVYLNLSRVTNVIDALPKDVVLVGTNNKHGRFYNINSGLMLFSDLQGPLTLKLLEDWTKSMNKKYYHSIEGDKLRDQRALNDIMHCNMSNVLCYHLNEKKRLGLVSHCFSCMNNDNPTAKHDCMVKAKHLVKEWDSGKV